MVLKRNFNRRETLRMLLFILPTTLLIVILLIVVFVYQKTSLGETNQPETVPAVKRQPVVEESPKMGTKSYFIRELKKNLGEDSVVIRKKLDEWKSWRIFRIRIDKDANFFYDERPIKDLKAKLKALLVRNKSKRPYLVRLKFDIEISKENWRESLLAMGEAYEEVRAEILKRNPRVVIDKICPIVIDFWPYMTNPFVIENGKGEMSSYSSLVELLDVLDFPPFDKGEQIQINIANLRRRDGDGRMKTVKMIDSLQTLRGLNVSLKIVDVLPPPPPPPPVLTEYWTVRVDSLNNK